MPSLRIPTTGDSPVDEWECAIRSVLSPDVAELVVAAELPGLQATPRDDELARWLSDHDPADAVVADSRSDVNASTVTSGLWLVCGELDRSHDISQNLKSPLGSFLHGVMHRREGDYGNAKYWFQRARCEDIESAVARLHPADYSDADDFVDRVQTNCRGGSGDADALVLAQWTEWIVLMVSIVQSR